MTSSGRSSEQAWALLRLPGQQPVWYSGQAKNDAAEKGFVFAPFEGKSIYITGQPQKWTLDAFDPPLPYDRQSVEEDLPDYQALVAQGLTAIRAGMLQKVVLSRMMPVEVDKPTSAGRLFSHLSALYPAACVYVAWLPGTGCWCGASPELLLHKKGNFAESYSLAGTVVKGSFQQKEWHEQQLVTNYIAETLKPFASEVVIREREAVAAAGLTHLRTKVEATLGPGQLWQPLAEALHPTPAICGLPASSAKDFILRHEGYDRQFYTGYFGAYSGENCDLYVNLRCAQLSAGKAALYAGAGIVDGSDPEKEFMETAHKMETILSALRTIAS